jgi:hypothetical protein
MAVVNNSTVAVVVLEADIRLTRHRRRAGLVARYNPAQGGQPESFYWARLINRNGKIWAEICCYANGQRTMLGRRALGGGGVRRLRFEVVGNQLTLSINGQVMVTAEDATLTAAGQVGLRARYGGSLDNFLATEEIG